MQTTQVSNAASMLSAPSPSRQSNANNQTEAFGQVLSRQVAEHKDRAEPQRHNENAQAARQPSKSSEKPAAAKPADTTKSAKEPDASVDANDGRTQVSDEMLALVASLSQIGVPADAKGALSAADSDDGAALAGAGRSRGRHLADLMDATQEKGGKDTALQDRDDADEAGSVKARGKPAADTDLAANAANAVKDAEVADGGKHGKAADFSANMQDSLAKVQVAAAPVQFQQHAAAQASHVAEKLTPAVGTPAWNNDLGQKITWMVAGEHQSATLTLNPPDLGPLHVVLNVSNSHASATFTAAQPEVREALESAMPKLREMLGESGIQLGQASVNAGSPNQQGTQGQDNPTVRRIPEQAEGVVETPVRAGRSSSVASTLGMVDTFV